MAKGTFHGQENKTADDSKPVFDNKSNNIERRRKMGSTYKIIELVGTSEESWEDATRVAVRTAGKSLEDLRVAEITRTDVTIENGEVKSFRVRLNISFKVVV